MRTRSLRYQLLRWLLVPFAITFLIGATVAYFFALRAAMNTYDLGLMDSALDLSRQVNVEQGKLHIDLSASAKEMLQINNEDRRVYAVWDENGHVVSGNYKLYDPDWLGIHNNHIYRDIELNGEIHREVLLRSIAENQNFYIAVTETKYGRERLAEGILAGILLPETLLALVAIIAIWIGVERGLAPVQRLRDDIASRTFSDLRAIDTNQAPSELLPIIFGINELLDKLSRSFDSHRRFIADASHQIRTPLAVLNTQIEVGLSQHHANEVRQLLIQLLNTTQRTTHLANQLLSLAKLEHTEYQLKPIALKQIFLDAAANLIVLADRKEIELTFELADCTIKGHALMIQEMLSNLLDNAIRYTPNGGKVDVQLKNYTITITDNGNGIPNNELDKIGTPFHRMSNNSNPNGCGLGLAIVKEIAHIHQATLIFGTGARNKGLRIEISFPNTVP